MSTAAKQLLWIGAGTAQFPALDFADYQNVTLIEARSEACELLERAYPQESVTVRQEVVLSKAGVSEFYEYSLGDFSSTQPVKDLNLLFPGIRLLEKRTMDTIDIAQLLSDLNIDGKDNVLVLDTPDFAYNILSSLIERGLLEYFCSLYVVTSNMELYAGMKLRQEIGDVCRGQYYSLMEIIEQDPDIPLLRFAYDSARHHQVHLEEQLQQANTVNDELNKKLPECESLITSRQQSFDESRLKSETNAREKAELLNHQILELQAAKESLELRLIEATNFANDEKQISIDRVEEVNRLLDDEKTKNDSQIQALQQELEGLKLEYSAQEVTLTEKRNESKNRFLQIKELQTTNKNLSTLNDELSERQVLLDKQLLKADLQLKLLETLLANPLKS